jgi:hypothetical protein
MLTLAVSGVFGLAAWFAAGMAFEAMARWLGRRWR